MLDGNTLDMSAALQNILAWLQDAHEREKRAAAYWAKQGKRDRANYCEGAAAAYYQAAELVRTALSGAETQPEAQSGKAAGLHLPPEATPDLLRRIARDLLRQADATERLAEEQADRSRATADMLAEAEV